MALSDSSKIKPPFHKSNLSQGDSSPGLCRAGGRSQENPSPAGRCWWNSSSSSSARGAGSTLPIPEGFWRSFGFHSRIPDGFLAFPAPAGPGDTGTSPSPASVSPNSQSRSRICPFPLKEHLDKDNTAVPKKGFFFVVSCSGSRREPRVGLSHSCPLACHGTSAAAPPFPSLGRAKPSLKHSTDFWLAFRACKPNFPSPFPAEKQQINSQRLPHLAAR